MDFGRPDPRFGAFGKVMGCRPFEVGRGIAYNDLWVREEDAGGDDAGQEGEEGGIGTSGRAHLGAETSETRARSQLA